MKRQKYWDVMISRKDGIVMKGEEHTSATDRLPPSSRADLVETTSRDLYMTSKCTYMLIELSALELQT